MGPWAHTKHKMFMNEHPLGAKHFNSPVPECSFRGESDSAIKKPNYLNKITCISKKIYRFCSSFQTCFLFEVLHTLPHEKQHTLNKKIRKALVF